MDRDKLVELAEACERHAAFHFDLALAETNDHAVGINNIDRGLECLLRAAALRSHGSEMRTTVWS